eukprot:m.110560 g.110560  ORF g.110560 m.110560 type:complete len:86 (+) comp9223_c1_seq1:522-779(+)
MTRQAILESYLFFLPTCYEIAPIISLLNIFLFAYGCLLREVQKLDGCRFHGDWCALIMVNRVYRWKMTVICQQQWSSIQQRNVRG